MWRIQDVGRSKKKKKEDSALKQKGKAHGNVTKTEENGADKKKNRQKQGQKRN